MKLFTSRWMAQMQGGLLLLLLSASALAQEVRRPTTETVSSTPTACSGAIGTTPAMSNFFDAGGEGTFSSVSGPVTSQSIPNKYKQAIISGWQAASGPYSSLTLKIRSACSSASGNSGCVLDYSTNGSTWSALHNGNWNDSTDFITLPASQNLSQLSIRYCLASGYDFAAPGPDRPTLTGYDIRTEGSLAPIAPSNLNGSPAANGLSVSVSWSDNSSNETGFSVERCTGAGCSNFAPAGSVGANVTTLPNTTSACTTYNYRAYASNAHGNSLFSNVVQVSTPCAPAAPSGLMIGGASSTSITLAWTDLPNETSYFMERCSGTSCTDFVQVSTPAANATTYTDPGLTPNAAYTYRARASNAVGFSPYSNTVTGVAEDTLSMLTPYVTKYTYDPLDRLVCVEQHGNTNSTGCAASESSDETSTWRIRRFEYNTVGQLLKAKNPESGEITYKYDADGNVIEKKDARNVTINYSYDALHRLTGKTYTGITETAVTYNYDEPNAFGLSPISNPIGRRTSMSDASGTTAWSYDPMGRVQVERRTISGQTKRFDYEYNHDGSVKSLKYPCPTSACTSQRQVNFEYKISGANTAARLEKVTDSDGTKYASEAAYYATGALKSVKYGVATGFAGITVRNTLNKRLQPALIEAQAPSQTLLSLGYDFGLGVNNNGNVYGIANNRASARSVAFTYDGMNRLQTAYTPNASTWGNKFKIDPWGNLEKMEAFESYPIGQNLNELADKKNRIFDFCYDAAGNLLRQDTCGATDYIYDGESRLKTAVVPAVNYTYDGDGVRVKKDPGADSALYWGSSFTAGPLAESTTAGAVSKEFIYFGSKRIARRDSSGVHYFFSDHLGSSNVVSNATGATIEEESDFYPFGGERVIVNSLSDQDYKFTSKERDNETDFDYFGARHYAFTLGRFVTPDEFPGGPVDAFSSNDPALPGPLPYADITNPQSLNKYTYTYNNPLRFTDPDGHCPGGCAVEILTGLTILVMATQAYYALPADKRDIGLAIRGATAIVKSWFQSDSGAKEVPPPPTTESSQNTGQTQPYDVGQAGDLKGHSVPGDQLDVHHVPQQQPASQTIKGYDGKTAPAIALPKGEHKAIPTDKGAATRTPRDQLAKDAKDLRNKTNTPNSQVKKVIDLNKQKYPEMKKSK